MLRESHAIVQAQDEPFRRWFFDDDYDLLVWFDDTKQPSGFQLIYETQDGQRVLTSRPSGALVHHQIDDGGSGPSLYDVSPLLAADGEFPIEQVLPTFLERAGEIEKPIVDMVVSSMKQICE